MRRRAIALAFVGLLWISHRTPAQQRVLSSVDVSGTSIWYADSLHASGASISPAVRLDWSRATLAASAELSGLGGGNVSTQGLIAPSIVTPAFGAFFGELAGSFGGSSHWDGTHTGQALGVARGYFARGSAGLWIGGGAGSAWDGSTWRAMRQAEGGAWVDRDGFTALATVVPTSVAGGIDYTDLQLAVRRPSRNYEVGASGGVRAGAHSLAIGGTSRVWGMVSLLRWMAPRLAIVASAGSYPVDLTQGFPGGRYATLALRVASASSRPPAARVASQDRSMKPASSTPSAFEVRSSGVRRTLRVYAPAAQSVELSADFTQWQAVALTRGDAGWWTLTRSIAPGTYQVNVRANGGSWIAPAGLLTTRDEFGISTGVLTLE